MIKAPSILGLSPSGVQLLADTLLGNGLNAFVSQQTPLRAVEDLNHCYSRTRDDSGMINTMPLRNFSLRLDEVVSETLDDSWFPVVLGGDCSILLGVMLALKRRGTYGLITFDAHADFYLPSQSTTGEAADMDIALVTGRGSEVLTNIDDLGPYVLDTHVIHVGQRDLEETLAYGSSQISQTSITRYDLEAIHTNGTTLTASLIINDIKRMAVEGFWLHLDSDVLNDEENPAVDYRLPGGLTFAECEHLMLQLMTSKRIIGMSVAIYNPNLDKDGSSGKLLTSLLARILTAKIEADA